MNAPLMEKDNGLGRVSIRQYENSSECDVIVAVRDREMVVRLPNYRLAVQWAEIESKSYKLLAFFPEG
jgi:hypothetical protein